MANIIDIEIYDKRSNAISNKIKGIVSEIFKELDLKNVSVEISLVSQERMRDINKRLRKKDRSTNVLSFPIDKSFVQDSRVKMLGEIFISMGYINNNGQDLRYILLHGILHLIGFDHIKTRDRIIMEKKEDSIMNKLV